MLVCLKNWSVIQAFIFLMGCNRQVVKDRLADIELGRGSERFARLPL